MKKELSYLETIKAIDEVNVNVNLFCRFLVKSFVGIW